MRLRSYMQRLIPNRVASSGERGRGSRTLFLLARRHRWTPRSCLGNSIVAAKPCKEAVPLFAGDLARDSLNTPTVQLYRPSPSSIVLITAFRVPAVLS